MTPMLIMEAGHQLIETVVSSLGGMVAAIEQGERVDVIARLEEFAGNLTVHTSSTVTASAASSGAYGCGCSN